MKEDEVTHVERKNFSGESRVLSRILRSTLQKREQRGRAGEKQGKGAL